MPQTQHPKVVVVGLGYIGLPTAAILAHKGVSVVGVDVNERTVDAVNAGTVPFVEPDLAGYVTEGVQSGRLRAAVVPERADVFVIAVPTPFKEDRSADLSYVEAAATAIATQLTGSELVILESTSPPGTTEFMARVIMEARPDLTDSGLLFAHCPERVLPGRVMVELVENDRIVGGLTPEAAQAAKGLYRVFCKGQILTTSAVTAELAKLVENSYRDVNIAFANELSLIAEQLNVDVWELIELANHHPRVNILQPGPGVGGHCIAVDPWFIVASAPAQAKLIRSAREVNDGKSEHVSAQIARNVDEHGLRSVALLGLAFKPDIDDLRESPSVEIAVRVAAQLPNTRFLIAEPHIQQLPASLSDQHNVTLTTAESAIDEAELVVVLVDHSDFRTLEKGLVADKRVIDTRGLFR